MRESLPLGGYEIKEQQRGGVGGEVGIVGAGEEKECMDQYQRRVDGGEIGRGGDLQMTGLVSGGYEFYDEGGDIGLLAGAVLAEGEEPSAEYENCNEHSRLSVAHDGDAVREVHCTEVLNEIGFGKFHWWLLLSTSSMWMAEAFEMIIVGFLLPIIREEWDTSTVMEGSIGSASFIGMLIGCYLWGLISDKYGRRTAFFGSGVWMFVSGILSAFSAGPATLIFFRINVGFGVGGGVVAFTYFSEFLPCHNRGFFLVVFELAWPVGAVLQAALAWAVLPNLSLSVGWRVVLAISAAPSLLAILLCAFFLPQSPRFFTIIGEEEKVERVLWQVARTNGKYVTPFRIKKMKRTSEPSLLELFKGQLKYLTSVLWIMWFMSALLYYGIVFITPELFEVAPDEYKCMCSTLPNSSQYICDATVTEREDAGFGECHSVCGDGAVNFDYGSILLSSAAEVPGLLLPGALIDIFGRKLSMFGLYIVCAVSLVLMVLFDDGWTLTLFSFLSRACGAASFTSLYIYTPEIYPSVIRTVGTGAAAAFARVAGGVTPYTVTVFRPDHSECMDDATSWAKVPLMVYALAAVVAACLTFQLKVETNNRDMHDFHVYCEDSEEESNSSDADNGKESVELI
eukprot:Nk52_evm38s1671 gene=Nk52_evmTU38s1671